MFLMPAYEPCGLNQIYSLRYGTIPVVRATGGLDDTIEPGARRRRYRLQVRRIQWRVAPAHLRAALQAYRDQTSWQALMRNGMNKDFS